VAKSKKTIAETLREMEARRIAAIQLRLANAQSRLADEMELARTAKQNPEPKKHGGDKVALAETLLKKAFPPNGLPPKDFQYKQTEAKLSPFYEEHGVRSAIKRDTLRRARNNLRQ
jgi:hypothetical protein